MVRWVKDISGNHYRVVRDYGSSWTIENDDLLQWTVPKSAFVECAPPERWEDVRVETGGDLALLYIRDGQHSFLVGSIGKPGYKFVGLGNNTFKIQKKVLDNQENP